MIRMAGPSVPETAERGWSETTPEAHARAVKTINDRYFERYPPNPGRGEWGDSKSIAPKGFAPTGGQRGVSRGLRVVPRVRLGR